MPTPLMPTVLMPTVRLGEPADETGVDDIGEGPRMRNGSPKMRVGQA
jgi:hypothetical protein